MRAQCDCGKFVPINLQTHGDYDNNGRPKLIGEGTCDCGRTVEVYITIHAVEK